MGSPSADPRQPTGPDRGSDSGARLGALLVFAGVLFSLPTFLTMPVRPSMRVLTVLMVAVRPPTALLALRFPWHRWHRRWLLAWPLWTMVGLANAGTLSFAHGAPALAGLFMTAFFFVGMTQTPGTSLLLLPIAVPCWIATYGGWSHDLLVRLPIAAGTWVLVAETLARLHHRTRLLTEGLVHQASTDPLTGLGNRRDLDRALKNLTTSDALIVLDLDHFKQLNDQFGHSAGDKVLADFGTTILEVLRPSDTAIRLGGEEMLLLLPAAGRVGAREVLARLSARWIRLQPNVTFSAGVSIVGDVEPSEALAEADQALYQAKHDGRNCSRFAGSRSATLSESIALAPGTIT